MHACAHVGVGVHMWVCLCTHEHVREGENSVSSLSSVVCHSLGDSPSVTCVIPRGQRILVNQKKWINAVYIIMLTFLVHSMFMCYIKRRLQFKRPAPGGYRLSTVIEWTDNGIFTVISGLWQAVCTSQCSWSSLDNPQQRQAFPMWCLWKDIFTESYSKYPSGEAYR
jgi:hypothetical protein